LPTYSFLPICYLHKKQAPQPTRKRRPNDETCIACPLHQTRQRGARLLLQATLLRFASTSYRPQSRTSRLRSSSPMRWTALAAWARSCTDGDWSKGARTLSYNRRSELLSVLRRAFWASVRRSLPIVGPPFRQGMNMARVENDARSSPLPRPAKGLG